MARERQTGFTIIELVIVIVIIGILAAIAVPKFISAQTDARVAKMNAVFGSIRTAAALAKSRCELDKAAGTVTCADVAAAANTVNMDGTAVLMAFNYPTAAAGGIGAAASINPSSDGFTASAGGATITYTGVGATTAANCVITYTAATAVATPATFAIVTTGC